MIEIKIFNGEDNNIKEKISSLMTSCLFEEYGNSVKIANVDDLINYYHSRQDSTIYYLENNSEFQGFIWIIDSSDVLTNEPFCFVLYLGIITESRKKGFAKRLSSHATQMAKSKGINEMKLTVRVNNLRAVGLYKSIGFKENKYEMIWKSDYT